MHIHGLSYLAQTNRSITVILDSVDDAARIRHFQFASKRLQASGIGIVIDAPEGAA
jgi:hypothetical protein